MKKFVCTLAGMMLIVISAFSYASISDLYNVQPTQSQSVVSMSHQHIAAKNEAVYQIASTKTVEPKYDPMKEFILGDGTFPWS